MGRKKYDPEFKAQVVREVIETNNNTALVGKRHNLSQRTVYNWFAKEKDKSNTADNKSLKSLKKELSESKLENQILRELLKKTYQVWPTEKV